MAWQFTLMFGNNTQQLILCIRHWWIKLICAYSCLMRYSNFTSIKRSMAKQFWRPVLKIHDIVMLIIADNSCPIHRSSVDKGLVGTGAWTSQVKLEYGYSIRSYISKWSLLWNKWSIGLLTDEDGVLKDLTVIHFVCNNMLRRFARSHRIT